jgi:hypothetical protein
LAPPPVVSLPYNNSSCPIPPPCKTDGLPKFVPQPPLHPYAVRILMAKQAPAAPSRRCSRPKTLLQLLQSHHMIGQRTCCSEGSNSSGLTLLHTDGSCRCSRPRPVVQNYRSAAPDERTDEATAPEPIGGGGEPLGSRDVTLLPSVDRRVLCLE